MPFPDGSVGLGCFWALQLVSDSPRLGLETLRVFSAVFIASILLEKGAPGESCLSRGLPEVVLCYLLPVLS